MSSWQNHYFQRGVSHGVQDGLERSFILCCGHFWWQIYFWIYPLSPLMHVSYACSCSLTYNMYWNDFISTLVTIFAPCWAFSWQVQLSTSATCLIWATLGSVAVTLLEVEGLDLIDGCCCSNSSIGLVSVEVFYCHLMLLGMLEEGLICDVLSLLLWSDPFFDLKRFWCMKKQLCSMYCFLSFSFVLASFYQFFYVLIKLVSCLMFSLSDVTVHLVNVVPVGGWHFKSIHDGLEYCLGILLVFLILWNGQCVPLFETFLT